MEIKGAALDASTVDEAPKVKRRWNWWKIGFFVMLFLFEGAREWAVIATYEPPKIAVSNYVGRVQTLVTAAGRWQRLDGGSPMVPGATKITCWQNERKCYEVSYGFLNGYVGEPSLDVFDAKFSDDAVTYENDNPKCARYAVRIDLKLKKVIATRDRKENPAEGTCQNMERRIEMTLGDGFVFTHLEAEHFLPIFWLIAKSFGNK